MKTTNNKPMGNGHNPTELVMQTGLELLPLIMNNIPQAVFWKDRDLVYLGCNQAFADDAGFSSPEEIIGKTDFEMPWRDQAELYRADDQRVIDIGEPKLNYEEPQTTPNGSTIWLSTSKIPVHENGEVIAVLGMYEDITERKQAEEALREREETFRALTETSVDTIMRFDRQHRHLYVNPIVEKQTGIPARDFIGKTHEELGFPEYLVELWGEAIEAVFTSGKPRRLEFELPNHSWVDWQVLPEFGTDGKVNYVVTFARDITERKQAEELVHQSETRFRSLFDTANDSDLPDARPNNCRL